MYVLLSSACCVLFFLNFFSFLFTFDRFYFSLHSLIWPTPLSVVASTILRFELLFSGLCPFAHVLFVLIFSGLFFPSPTSSKLYTFLLSPLFWLPYTLAPTVPFLSRSQLHAPQPAGPSEPCGLRVPPVHEGRNPLIWHPWFCQQH